MRSEDIPRPKAPQGIGKTEAEKLIYTITVLAWLALPFAIGNAPSPSDTAGLMYYIFADLVLAGTVTSLIANPHVPHVEPNASGKMQPTGGTPNTPTESQMEA